MSTGAVAVRSSSAASTSPGGVCAPEPPRTPGQHGLGGVDRLEPQPGLPHPRRGAMGLCHDRLPILPLPADEGGPWTAWRP